MDPQKVSSQARLVLKEMSSGLEELVTSDPRFLGRTTKIIRTPQSASPFYPTFLGPKLLERTFDTGSASAAIAWLQKVLSTRAANGKFITALWNAPVDSEVQLTPDFRLVPFDSIPLSVQKQALENIAFQRTAISAPLALQPPSSALVAPYQVVDFICNYEQRAIVDGKYPALKGLAADITLLLTLMGPRAAIQVAHWFNFDDPDFEFALSGASHGSQIMEILPRLAGQNPPILNGAEAVEIIRQFNALAPSTKEKIRTATERLRRALLRHQPADRAVEVSIALEILCGDAQPSEMTHKVKVRAVRLLEGSRSVRERNRILLTKTYAVRSKLVHQGIYDTKPTSVGGASVDVDAAISEACHLCAELIKTIIRRGAFPDWQHFDVNDHGAGLSETLQ